MPAILDDFKKRSAWECAQASQRAFPCGVAVSASVPIIAPPDGDVAGNQAPDGHVSVDIPFHVKVGHRNSQADRHEEAAFCPCQYAGGSCCNLCLASISQIPLSDWLPSFLIV